MVANERDLHQVEDDELEEEVVHELDDELVDLDALDDEDDDPAADDDEDDESEEETDEEDEEAETVASDSESTSLEELLDQRSAARRGTDDADEDVDFSDLSSEASLAEARAKSKVAPLRNREEFVCKRCFLLKPKVQLADPERMLCRDCV